MNRPNEQDFSSRLNLAVWKRFLRYAGMFRREFILLACCLAGLALLENLTPLLTRYAIDRFILARSAQGMLPYSLVYLLIVVLQAGIIRFFLYFAGRIETGLNYEIRKAGFQQLQELSFAYFDRTPVGWIMARMVADTNRLSEVVAWSIVDIAWGMTTILVVVIAMFLLNWQLALSAIALIPILMVVSWLFQKRLLAAHRQIRKINSRLTGEFNEGIMGARTTKTLQRETANSGEFAETAGNLYRESVKASIFAALFMPIVSLLGAAGTAVVLTIGGGMVLDGAILTGTLYATIIYVTRIWDPIKHVARVMTSLQSAQAAAERVMALLAEKPDIGDRPEVLARYGPESGAGSEPWPECRGEVTFEDVTFSYGSEEIILEHFNLHVPAGQVVALVGETGAGKSTIVNLACRFYEPVSGRILIDGTDYRERPLLWLYANLGYVLQTPQLFSGSVAENIGYGDLSASPEQIEDAARLVFAHDFISRLENGYATSVGESGNRLSTGEKQLISFARAIIANPRIFVLDEATSSVDTETEFLIQKAIQAVLKGRTAFIIAHRLSTIRQSDRILVISDGKIVEDGNHQDLMRQKGRYCQLYMNQFLREAIDQASAPDHAEQPVESV